MRQQTVGQHRCAEPVTQQQGDLDIGSVAGYGSAAALDRAVDAVFHRVEVEMEFLGCSGIARAATHIHQQCLAQPLVTFRRRCQRAEYVADHADAAPRSLPSIAATRGRITR